jgi:acetyl-CoA carboxylase biotin carboxylase subunit
MFKKVLIANRGEIAVRVIRACREMGLRAVAVFSEVDRASEHVLLADEAYPIGAAPSTESYLRIDKLMDAARRAGADALHPGYGFLAENPALARACREAGVTFIGPSPEAMELMGSKTAARQAAERAGVPMVPGAKGAVASAEEAAKLAVGWGYPVLLKAVAGGGGKGMRLVRATEAMPAAWRDAQSEAQNAFGDPALYVEKRLERPRHVEIQVLGDRHGTVIHLGERECSLQRRHQKLVEECPSPVASPALRAAMGEAAVRLARAASYTNAGTVEFLVVPSAGNPLGYDFYFLEVNARLQVEHPVTEMVTGIDLVKEQIRLAAGERLSRQQGDIEWRGHALEVRVYAEDPTQNFFPSPGRITRLERPAGPGVRVDGYVYEGWTVPLEYDPLLAKLVCWGGTRAEAIARLRRALEEYVVGGIQTNLSFFRRLVEREDFSRGEFDTELIDRMLTEPARSSRPAGPAAALDAAAVAVTLAEATASPNGVRRPVAAIRWRQAARESALRRLERRQR